MATSAPITNWSAVASSADGSRLLVVGGGYGFNGPVFISTNSGDTWNDAPVVDYGNYGWSVAGCSADGNTLVVASGGKAGGRIFYSTNGGTIWTDADPSATGNQVWHSGAPAADGQKIVVVGSVAAPRGASGMTTSTNGGAAWIGTSDMAFWQCVACSADGHRLFAAEFGGGIWTSQTTPAPLLKLTPSESGFLISWVVPSMSFVLQENADLRTTGWTDVTTKPILNFTNLHHEVSVPTSSTSRFYRLKGL